MFISLVRWFAGRGKQAERPEVRFTPQLEGLGLRITPASRPSSGGDISWLTSSAVQTAPIEDEVPTNRPGAGTVSIYASKPTNNGDIWAFTTSADVRSNGNEILRDLHGAGTVSMYGTKPGIASGTNAEALTEAPDGIWVGSPIPNGVEVSPSGGRGGMSGDLSY